ncbi:hypothetical protein DXG01_001482 [Tephrocybe rancida]|nr:hypothetical protein DXG01_001482 [Tephrocybe rancida]
MLTTPEPDNNAPEFWHLKSSNPTPRNAHVDLYDDPQTGHALDHDNSCDLKKDSAGQRPGYFIAQPSNPANDLKCPHEESSKGAGGKNERVHKKHCKCLDAQAEMFGHHPVRPEVVATHMHGAPTIPTNMTHEEFPVNSGGFTARPSQLDEEGWFFASLQEALNAGYQLIKWNRKTCMPLVCKDGRIFACLVGHPDNLSYLESCQLAYKAIMEEGRNTNFSHDKMHHKRGDFPAVNIGVTMGLGATYPMNLRTGPHADMMDHLLANKYVVRMADCADAAFNFWAPNIHKLYHDTLNLLFKGLPYLRRIFPCSIFPAAAFNFGLNIFTKAHRDTMNLPVGWCAIQALGKFGHMKGGHMVFPCLKLVVEFPPGALILIPSAMLTHTNIPVQEGDCHVSFTQYCAGGLFRYVENGFQTDAQLLKDDPGEHERLRLVKDTQWERDYQLYRMAIDCVAPV